MKVWILVLLIVFVIATWSFSGCAKKAVSLVKDPVCGMQVEESKAASKSVYKGKTYYFCSPGCKQQFDKQPEKYIK